MEYFRRHWVAVFVSLLFVVFCGWGLLLPGYILLLDWGHGPQALLGYATLSELMNVPVNVTIYFLTYLLPGWFVQKCVFVGLLFALFFVPVRYLPFGFPVRLFGAVFFAMNPFVYERMISGQWRVVAGYILCFLLVLVLMRARPPVPQRTILQVVSVLTVTGFFSTHFFVIGVLVYALFLVWHSIYAFLQKAWCDCRHILLQGVMNFLIVGVVSLYWIVPYISLESGVSPLFEVEHQGAFVTASGEHVGALLNVLSLHGFWGESRPWAEQFILPKAWTLTFGVGVLFVSVLSAVGIGSGILWRRKERGGRAMSENPIAQQMPFLLAIGSLSIVFSVGVSATIFQPFNAFLFDAVPFWSGFRDTQKWSGVFVMVWVLFASGGLHSLLAHLATTNHRGERALAILAPLFAALLTPMMLFGFFWQVQVTDYPEGWYDVRAELLTVEAVQPDCRALFLPWHQYYAASFNPNGLGANTARHVFPCDVVTGHNTGIGGIEDRASHIEGYAAISAIVQSNDPTPAVMERHIESLREIGITHIIFTDDLAGRDVYQYPFLDAAELVEIYAGEGIVLWEIRD